MKFAFKSVPIQSFDAHSVSTGAFTSKRITTIKYDMRDVRDHELEISKVAFYCHPKRIWWTVVAGLLFTLGIAMVLAIIWGITGEIFPALKLTDARAHKIVVVAAPLGLLLSYFSAGKAMFLQNTMKSKACQDRGIVRRAAIVECVEPKNWNRFVTNLRQ